MYYSFYSMDGREAEIQRHKQAIVFPSVNLAGVEFLGENGTAHRLTGFVEDEENLASVLATLQSFNLIEGEATTEHGHFSDAIREAGKFVWKRRGKTAVAAAVTVTVAVGSLYVRYKKKS